MFSTLFTLKFYTNITNTLTGLQKRLHSYTVLAVQLLFNLSLTHYNMISVLL